MSLLLVLVIIIAAVYAIYHQVDVRLVLLVAALILGTVAGNVMSVIQTFFVTFANEQYVVPICMAMGFAYVLRKTECDQHLVHLLVKPLVKVRWALIPGTIIVGFLVNIPIISQTSTAVTLGAVVIPILLAAKLSRVTIGATLLLGCSIGGELLNPGAPELRVTVAESNRAIYQRALGEANTSPATMHRQIQSSDVIERILPLNMLGLVVATGLFWWMSARAESRYQAESPEAQLDRAQFDAEATHFKVNLLKASIPLLPLFLLFLTGPPLNLVSVPTRWLLAPAAIERVPVAGRLMAEMGPVAGFPAGVPWVALAPVPEVRTGLFDSRLIGFAMLIGVVVAAVVSWRSALHVPRAFFEGAGYAFTNIISLIVTANCFGTAIRGVGVDQEIGRLIEAAPVLLIPFSGLLPWAFAVLCGSGMASTTSLFEFFAAPALEQNVDPALAGAVVSLASAAGRTMSPVAAVCLMCSTLTNTNPFDLVKRVAPPLILAVIVIIAAAMVIAMLEA